MWAVDYYTLCIHSTNRSEIKLFQKAALVEPLLSEHLFLFEFSKLKIERLFNNSPQHTYGWTQGQWTVINCFLILF